MKTIVIVDDEVNVLKSLQRILRGYAWEIISFSNPLEALEFLETRKVDLVLSDFQMPDLDGATFLSYVMQRQPSAMRLILSGHADLNRVLEAINRAEVYRFITKPWNDNELRLTIEQALDVGALIEENKQLAQLVREQGDQIRRQLNELQKIEELSPGITKVDWDDDGYIDLSDN